MCISRGTFYNPKSVISVGCNTCVCSDGFWNCTTFRCPRVCSVLGMGHYQTFDGNTYTFIGSCDYYTLIEDYIDKSLKIEYTNRQLISSSDRSLRITYFSNVIVMANNTLSFNHLRVSRLPLIRSDLTVQKRDPDFWIVKAKGIRILFDGIRVYISLRRNYENKVRGLCGTYTYKSDDDFLTPNGIIEENTETFVNSYRNESTCSGRMSTTHDCATTNRESCNQLRNYSCGLDTEYYVKMCLADLCLDLNTQYQLLFRCSAFAAYAFECAKLGNPLINWLTTLNCTASNLGRCSGSKVYKDCANECNSTCAAISARDVSCNLECVPGCACNSDTSFLDESTNECVERGNCSCLDKGNFIAPNVTINDYCSNCTCLNGTLECSFRNPSTIRCPSSQEFSFNASKCPLTCDNYPDYQDCGIYVSGCACPKDQVLYNITTCIQKEKCPCKQGDNYYPPGFVLNRQCQSCTCNSGFWNCVRIPCSGICRATGDPHYVTFDNFAYSFQGSCKYVLVTTVDRSLQIIAENVKCAADGSTCTKSIEIFYQNYSLILRRGMETLVNGLRIDIFFRSRFFAPDLTISKIGVLQIVKATDFEVRWDGVQNVYIIAGQNLRGKVQGLCGNYNGLIDDDIMTQTGAPAVNTTEAAHSWRIDSSCIPPEPPKPACLGTEYRRKWAEDQCGLLKNSSIGTPFRDCNLYLTQRELEEEYDKCVFDMCK
jgi:hypothetical protein